MILSPGQFSIRIPIETDVAVVGAGPIGIATSLELARAGIEVALIESGFEHVDRAAQELSAFDSGQDDFFHSPSELSVRRQVGGTTALWGGRCVKFDPIDFEDRPITAQARWPIRYVDVEPYLQRACDWAVCGQAAFNARDIPEIAHRDMVPGLPDDGVRTSDLERWSLPTRFGRQYAAALRDSPGLTLWTGLTCTEIVTTQAGDSVDHLVVKTLDGRQGSVVAADYVIATGGLEATRLLLASNRHHPHGLGNQGGHLGRWYMSHVEARVAAVHFAKGDGFYKHERDSEGVYVRRRFTFSPRFQRELGMPNAAVWLVNPPVSDPAHRTGILSAVYLTLHSRVGRFLLAEAIREEPAKTGQLQITAHLRSIMRDVGRFLLSEAIRVANAENDTAPQVLAHLRNIVRDLFPSTRLAVAFCYTRFVRKGRKAPGFVVKSADNRYPIQYHGEHLPHWESWVELCDERDALGMRRIRTHTHFSDADYEGVRKAIVMIDEHLRRHGVGHVEWLTDDVEGSVRTFMEKSAGPHQAGTTRMSETPEGGVVDRHLQIHGVRGLYVASTSVFPTSGQASPTLLGIALGIRLADRLAAGRMKRALRGPAANAFRRSSSP